MGDPDRGWLAVLCPCVHLVDLSPVVLPDQRNHVLMEGFPMRRSQFIISAGIGVVATVLAACTTYGKKPEASGDSATTTKAPPTTGGTAPEPANVITKTADVPVGSGVIVGEVVVTQAVA